MVALKKLKTLNNMTEAFAGKVIEYLNLFNQIIIKEILILLVYLTFEIFQQVAIHSKFSLADWNILKFHRITKDPETVEFIMVLGYAKDGNLRNYF